MKSAPTHKRRRNSQANNLNQEPILLPLILPTHDTSRIPNNLQNDSGHHSESESRGSTSDAIGDQEADEGESEDDYEDYVRCEVYSVEVVGRCDGTVGAWLDAEFG